MNTQNNHDPEYLILFMCFILSLLGGTARELSKQNECFDWRRFLSNIFISGFCGILVGLFSPDFEHKNWVMAAAGIAGTAGVSFLDFCWEILKALIGKLSEVVQDKK